MFGYAHVDLIQRMVEVSSWVVHLIIMQPTHEDRLYILQCIVRLLVCLISLGNFNAVVEILTGTIANLQMNFQSNLFFSTYLSTRNAQSSNFNLSFFFRVQHMLVFGQSFSISFSALSVITYIVKIN